MTPIVFLPLRVDRITNEAAVCTKNKSVYDSPGPTIILKNAANRVWASKAEIFSLVTGIGAGIGVQLLELMLDPLPYPETWLLSIESVTFRILIFYAGLLTKFLLVTSLIYLVVGTALGFVLHRHNDFTGALRSVVIGSLLVLTIFKTNFLGGRNADLWFLLYLGQVMVVMLCAYVSLRAGVMLRRFHDATHNED